MRTTESYKYLTGIEVVKLCCCFHQHSIRFSCVFPVVVSTIGRSSTSFGALSVIGLGNILKVEVVFHINIVPHFAQTSTFDFET